MTLQDAKVRRTAPLRTPSNLSSNSVKLISAALTEMLADMFALYLKTKNFHCRVSGPHFRDDHRMLDEQGAQIPASARNSVDLPEPDGPVSRTGSSGDRLKLPFETTARPSGSSSIRSRTSRMPPAIGEAAA